MITDIVRPVYNNTLRPVLPRRVRCYNGVLVPGGRLLDVSLYRPGFKDGTVRNLRQQVKAGDRVVVVGGGWGVSTVTARRQGATVTVYEAAGEKVATIKRALELNEIDGGVDIHHAVVGLAFDVFGEDIGDSIPIADLPEADVLELDCEGTEQMILANLTYRPRVIIVEVHPQFGVAVEDIEGWLTDHNYAITDRDTDGMVTLVGVAE